MDRDARAQEEKLSLDRTLALALVTVALCAMLSTSLVVLLRAVLR
ncbi:hypothetical protein [Labilithrix luteola]|nr:hypothetical protein [Labilithrix luteola]